MASPVIDWIRLSQRWTAILTPDRQRALASLSVEEQQAFFDRVADAAPLSDADRQKFSSYRGKDSALPGPPSADLVEKVFAAANRQFDQFAASKGIKVPETMMLA